MTVSTVVGCGYVGRSLARRLVKSGHEVYGVTRSGVDIQGVESLKRDVTDEALSLPDSDYIFYLVSAGSRDADAYRRAYVEGQRNTVSAVSDAQFVYGSSTGVYETSDGSWVDETTEIQPRSERTRVMLEAEEIAKQNGGKVVRFAGLYGPNRYGLDRYLDGSRVPAGYLNLLHREDAAKALEHVAGIESEHKLYLACDNEPVDRHEFARWLAHKTGRELGNLVDETKQSNKRCSNTRLRSSGWNPNYPTFRQGYSEIV